LNENIEWHCTQLELNWIEFLFNWIEFNNWTKIWSNWIQIQLKRNDMNIGGKGVAIVCEYDVEIKKLLLKTHL